MFESGEAMYSRVSYDGAFSIRTVKVKVDGDATRWSSIDLIISA